MSEALPPKRFDIRPRLPFGDRFRRGAPRPLAGPPRVSGSLLRLSLAIAVGYSALAGGLAYWQVIEAQRLTTDPLNPIVLAAARNAPRGTIYDAKGNVLADNAPGSKQLREYPYLVAAPVVGYRSSIFGTAGLERTYNAQLTGLTTLRAGDELLRKFRDQAYNPSDVHTSLDIDLQQAAADLLGDQRGAVVAIEPSTGRILAIVSSPTYNPNKVVDASGGRRYVAGLQARSDSPLLNRATQGLYVPGSVFKIVTAISRSRLWLDHPADHVPRPARGVRHRLSCRRLPHPRLAARCADRPPSRLLRGDRGLEQHLVRARWPGHRRGEPDRVRQPIRFRRTHSVRSAHLTQPADQRRRAARRVPRPGLSWPTRPTASPRCSSRRCRWRSSRRRSPTTAC